MPAAGRAGWPHKRLLWMDISTPADPVLLWADSPVRLDPSEVKDDCKMKLVEIADIKAGRATDVLQRSGSAAEAAKYMSFTHAETKRTLDVEFPSAEAAEWAFKKVNLLFNAYYTTQQEKLKDDSITVRVVGIVDGGASAKPNLPAAKGAAASAAKKTAAPPSQVGALPGTPRTAAALYPHGAPTLAGLHIGSPGGRAYTPVHHPSLQNIGPHASHLRAMTLGGSARPAPYY
jgi:hypothetical protein